MLENKKKKSNVKREVRLGAWSLLVASPIAIIGFVLSIAAIITGIRYMQAGDFRYQSGVELVTIFSAFIAIYLSVGYLCVRRFRELRKRSQQLSAEHNRVTDMMDNHAIHHRLMDQPLHHRQHETMQDKSSGRQTV